MFQDKVVEKIKTQFYIQYFFFRKSCRLWDNVEKYGRGRQPTDDSVTRHMRIACWLTKATDTHSECVILIAFPWQQWSRERDSMLQYTYIACLVYSGHSIDVCATFASVLQTPTDWGCSAGGHPVRVKGSERQVYANQAISLLVYSGSCC